MRDTAQAVIDGLLLEGRLAKAAATAAQWTNDGRHMDPALRRLSAGVFALSGTNHALAAMLAPRLLLCGDADDVHAYLADLPDGGAAHDRLSAGIALAWCGNAPAAYALLTAAHDAAVAHDRLGVAIGALERLSHHALLFGDIETARDAIAKAFDLASGDDLAYWRARCAATASRLASDAGDDETARRLIRDEAPGAHDETKALFGPAAVYLAAVDEDRAALAAWASPEMLETALYENVPELVIAATATCLAACDPKSLPPLARAALRRALLQADDATAAPEFFSLVARCGDVSEASFAANALLTVASPSRRNVEAHRLLARAHVDFRFGRRVDAIDHASDAARAFDALGLRRWTKEAMLLLVHREGAPDHPVRRRPTALSLTEREQQVAHLIRRGASNREVAHTLQISEHTVERHVSSILSRLGLRSRWQIVDAAKVDEQH